MTTTTDSLKPREDWNQHDRMDFLDGWHEASDLGFRSTRNTRRQVQFRNRDGDTVHHLSGAIKAAGRAARERHREATGL